MLAITKTVRVLFAWLASGRFVDLVSARHHTPYLTRHRVTAIVMRVRLIAAAFSVLTLIWIALDAATLSADLWPLFAACRALAAVVFLLLAITPDREQSRAAR